jgi:hypothetical protein
MQNGDMNREEKKILVEQMNSEGTGKKRFM